MKGKKCSWKVLKVSVASSQGTCRVSGVSRELEISHIILSDLIFLKKHLKLGGYTNDYFGVSNSKLLLF